MAGDKPEQTYGENNIQVCKEYRDQMTPTLLISQAVSIVIVVVNVILKQITILLMQWIGYDTHS